MAGLEVEVITLGGEDDNFCNDQFGFYDCIFNLPNVIKKLYQLLIAGCGMPSNSCCLFQVSVPVLVLHSGPWAESRSFHH